MNNLETLLKNGEVNVKFYKRDGSIRTMRCTKNFSQIPEGDKPKTGKSYDNDNLLRVYDLDKSAWRSFIIENVIEFS